MAQFLNKKWIKFIISRYCISLKSLTLVYCGAKDKGEWINADKDVQLDVFLQMGDFTVGWSV